MEQTGTPYFLFWPGSFLIRTYTKKTSEVRGHIIFQDTTHHQRSRFYLVVAGSIHATPLEPTTRHQIGALESSAELPVDHGVGETGRGIVNLAFLGSRRYYFTGVSSSSEYWWSSGDGEWPSHCILLSPISITFNMCSLLSSGPECGHCLTLNSSHNNIN